MTLPTILLPGEGKSVSMTTTKCTFKVTGGDTHGHFGAFELTLEPGSGGPNLHIHKQMVEIFYVIEGEVELTLNQQTMTAAPETFMIVPENTPHTFANPGTERSKLMIMFCPDNSREKYFEGLSELMKDGRKPTQEELKALTQAFDQYSAQ